MATPAGAAAEGLDLLKNSRLLGFCRPVSLALALFLILTCPGSARAKTGPEKNRPASRARGGVQIQFAFSGDVAQVPAQVDAALVLVPVRVNGTPPSWFLLDTARETSAIDDVRAVGVGLYLPSPAGGRPQSFSNVTLEFPGLKISLPSLGLDSFEDFSARIGHAVDGVLGLDVLSHLVMKVNYQGQVVQFYDPKAFQYSGRGAEVPVKITEGIPAVEGRVSVRRRGKFTGLVAIATAQTEPVEFSPRFAAGHDLTSVPEKMLPFPGADAASDTDVTEFLGRVEALQFGKVTFVNPIGVFPSKSDTRAGTVPPEFVCAVGGETLDRFTLILNYPERLLILEPNRSFPSVFTADMSGLAVVAIPPAFNRFEVAQVARKSPAAAAGIAVGDMIEKVDGQAASDYTLDDLRSVLRQDGTQHTLSLSRNGKAIEVKIALKPLV